MRRGDPLAVRALHTFSEPTARTAAGSRADAGRAGRSGRSPVTAGIALAERVRDGALARRAGAPLPCGGMSHARFPQRGRFVVVGLGRVGRRFVALLRALGAEVVVVTAAAARRKRYSGR